MNAFRLSLSFLQRDWRAGEWRILVLSLILATGSLSTVGLFSDRVRQALNQESHSLLGADLRISSSRPIAQEYQDIAMRHQLRIAKTATFPSMVATSNDSLLVEIQAIGNDYPLRGKIIISESSQVSAVNRDTGHIATSIPAPGSIWADAKLLRRLNLKIGDEVFIGKLKLKLAAHVIKDIDQAVSFASMAPRVQINLTDLPRTGLVQEGSRISYRLLLAGETHQTSQYRKWATARLKTGEKIEDVRDARPEIRQTMERAEHFLGLAALMTFVLAGIAMALAARHYIERHLDACAVMRCLGASQKQLLNIYLFQFILVGLIGILIGNVVGWAVQTILVSTLEALSASSLPQSGLIPVLKASTSGFALLLGFTFLPLWQLKSVSALRVLRRELGLPEKQSVAMYALGAVILLLLFLWQAGSVKLGLTVIVGIACVMLLIGVLSWLGLSLLGILPLPGTHLFFANLARQGRSNTIQIVALSLGGMSLLLLTLVKTELMQNWQERLPPDTPNRFIVNVQPDQKQGMLDFFARHGLQPPRLYPMVRGRLIAINDRPVISSEYTEQRARGLVERETNLSWNANIPDGNTLLQGRWIQAETADHDQPAEISLEDGLAKTLGINLHDMLTYDVGGSTFTAKVVNLRKVRWDSMQVNFFVITQPGRLDEYPTSFLTSFYLPPDKLRLGDELLKTHPNLLVIDTEAILQQIRQIMDQIATTLGAIFLFTLTSGLAVLYASLIATQHERIFQSAIMRTLGADSRYIHKQHLAEFAILGAFSGFFAAAASSSLGWILARYVLDIPFSPPAILWFTAIGCGILIVMTSGWIVTRKAVKLPPLQVLST